jgi:tripartite ATP-independent transporter DctP family solute receptor
MRRLLLLGVFLGAVLSGCSENGKDDEKATRAAADATPAPIKWRFALEEIQGSVQDVYARRFAEIVERETGGEVSIDVYPYGSLGTSAQLTELVRSGAVQLAFASPGHLGSVIPEVQVFSIHYLFPKDEELIHRTLRESPTLFGPLAQAYEEKRLKMFALIPEGWMVWTANKPIRKPADFRGVKIRTMVSPLLLKAYKAYGANPTPMPYSEVYSGLQLNMIDAQANPVFAIEEMAFHEQQEYMIFGYHLPFVASLVINPEFYESLPADQKQALMSAERELDDYIFEQQKALNRKRLEKIEQEGGTEIIHLNEAQIADFRKAASGIPEEYVKLVCEAGDKPCKRGKAILDGLRSELQ